jgi:hypothetical protein
MSVRWTSAAPAFHRADSSVSGPASTAPRDLVEGDRPFCSGSGAQGRARCQRCRCPGGQDGPFLCPRQCGVGQHIPGMIKYQSGMQNGVQIVNIFIKAAVWIGHIVLLHSFRFGTQRKNGKPISRPHRKKFDRSFSARRGLGRAGRTGAPAHGRDASRAIDTSRESVSVSGPGRTGLARRAGRCRGVMEPGQPGPRIST